MYPIATVHSVIAIHRNQIGVSCVSLKLRKTRWRKEQEKKKENTQREKQAERYFSKCGGKLYIHKSINRAPVCAAVHFVRCSAFSEAEKYACFFVNCVPWPKTIWLEMVVKCIFFFYPKLAGELREPDTGFAKFTKPQTPQSLPTSNSSPRMVWRALNVAEPGQGIRNTSVYWICKRDVIVGNFWHPPLQKNNQKKCCLSIQYVLQLWK